MKHLRLLIIIILSTIVTSCAQNKTEQSTKKGIIIEHVSNIDFKAMVEGKEVQLIDVRTPGEYAQGHLENAIMLNVRNVDFIKKATEKLDKNKPVYVYCRSGSRSTMSAKKLKKEGFTKIYEMKGGFLGWRAANFKEVK